MKQAAANRVDSGRCPHEGHVDACFRHGGTDDGRCDEDRNDVGEHADA